MLKLAVHLHIYYQQMWDDIRAYLENIGDYPYHLCVTLSADNNELKKQISDFHPDCEFAVLENRGYDVAPFIWFLHHTDLQKYDLILKIHTKNRFGGADTLINGRYLSRKLWWNCLIGDLIGSAKIFKNNIKAFKDEKLGMIGSRYLITADDSNSAPVRRSVISHMKKLGYQNFEFLYVAGTMFFVRASLMQVIKENYDFKDFELTDAKIKNGSLAHVMERLFGCVVGAQGYTIKGIYFAVNISMKAQIIRIKRFFYQKKKTQKGFLIVKICKIPVWHQKVTTELPRI